MRPFKIPKTNKWVDLDTIQSINEPVSEPERSDLVSNFNWNIVLEWHHAFRDLPDFEVFSQKVELDDNVYRPTHDDNGEPDRLTEITNEVFKPFFEAWTGAQKDRRK